MTAGPRNGLRLAPGTLCNQRGRSDRQRPGSDDKSSFQPACQGEPTMFASAEGGQMGFTSNGCKGVSGIREGGERGRGVSRWKRATADRPTF